VYYRSMNDAELLAVVDENDVPLLPLSRAEVSERGLWARSAYVWIVNDSGQILCHQRSFAKPRNGGKWNGHFGGYGRGGEEYTDTALREVREEIGLDLSPESLHLYLIQRYEFHHTFQGVFTTKWSGNANDLKLQRDEVAQVMWLTPAQIRKQPTDEWVSFGYEEQLLQEIEQNRF